MGSAFNVVLDFSQILTEIDEEQRIAETIEGDSKAELEQDKSKLKKIREQKIADAKAALESSQKTPFDREKMKKAVDEAEGEFDIDANKLNADNVARLKQELQMFRSRMMQIKQAKRGAIPEIRSG